MHAGGNLNLTATDSVSANPLVGQGSVSGYVSFGASVSIVDIASVTDASIGSGARVDASNSGPGNLSVGASFTDNVTPQVYAGTAGGTAALGAQVAIINDTSSQSATIGSGATIARANSVNIVATVDRTLNAQALGGTASLLVAAGAAIAQASVTGGTTAALGSQANVGGGDVGSVTVNASANDVVTTSAFAVAAGILAGNGADATASVTPSVAASIGSSSTIDLTGDASVLATSTTSALATTTGVNVSALGFSDASSLGGSVSTAQVAPTITASVGSGTVLDVADLTLRALSDDTSNALASASAGTLLAGDSARRPTAALRPPSRRRPASACR